MVPHFKVENEESYWAHLIKQLSISFFIVFNISVLYWSVMHVLLYLKIMLFWQRIYVYIYFFPWK